MTRCPVCGKPVPPPAPGAFTPRIYCCRKCRRDAANRAAKARGYRSVHVKERGDDDGEAHIFGPLNWLIEHGYGDWPQGKVPVAKLQGIAPAGVVKWLESAAAVRQRLFGGQRG